MDIIPRDSALLVRTAIAGGQESSGKIAVSEVYLDGKLQKAELIDDDEKSFGIFMHSLILSNYAEVMQVNSNQISIVGDDVEKAIFQYAASKGFNKRLFESIAPKVEGVTLECENGIRVSTHLINEKLRIVSRGTPEHLLRRCTHILLDSKFVKFSRKVYREVNDVLLDMLYRCKSVYAIAIKDIANTQEILKTNMSVTDMALVALVGVA